MESRKWYIWTLFQGKNKGTDVENEPVALDGEGERRIEETHTLNYNIILLIVQV